MNIYTSSQETSRHEHPQHRVEASKISDSRPPNKARSLPRQVRQALMFGQVDTGFQFLRVSKELGTNVKTKILCFYSTTPQRPQRLQRVGGGILSQVIHLTFETESTTGSHQSPVVLITGYLDTTTRSGWGTVNNTTTTVQNKNDSDNNNTGNWNQC